MGGDGSASGGCRQYNNTCLTAMPSAACRLPPPLCSVTSCLLDLYRKCMDNGGWARVLYDSRGGMEKFIFIWKIQPSLSPTVPAPLLPNKPGCLASERRWSRDKRRREAWAERRCNRSQPRLHTQSMEDEVIARPATTGIATSPVATSPLPKAHPALPPQLALLPPTVLRQPAPPLRKWAKPTSKWLVHADVLRCWLKNRKIPQINGCCSPPLSSSPATPNPACCRIYLKTSPAAGDIISALSTGGAHAAAGLIAAALIAAAGAIAARYRSCVTCACDSSRQTRPACRAFKFSAHPWLHCRHDLGSQL